MTVKGYYQWDRRAPVVFNKIFCNDPSAAGAPSAEQFEIL